MILRYFLLLAIAPAFLSLFAQETPVRVSEFNYGVTGESQIDNVQEANGVLYGAFDRFYGDDNAGLLSRIDPATGAATAILNPDVTEWFGGRTSTSTPSVIAVGDLTFGIQQDLGSGANLYRIEGDEATLLMSNSNFSFSEMVELNDTIYFVVGGLPISQSPNQFDSQVAELWRTDGTPEGTVMVTSLLSLFNANFVHLEAGDSTLLISLVNDSEQVFYIYDAPNATLGLLAEGFSQLILDLTVFPTRFNPIGYFDGGFYIFGRRSGNLTNQIFRVDEETYVITPIDLPEVFDPFFVFETYDQIDFVSFQDSLYVFAGRSFSGNGVDLYRVQGENGTDLEGLLVNSQTMGTILAPDDYLSVIKGDTLFFLSRRPETDLALYAYSSGMESAEVRAIMDGPPTSSDGYGNFWLNVSDNHFFASSRKADGLIYRVDRTTGLRDSAAFSFRPTGSGLYNPLATVGGSLFFIDNNGGAASRGLYRWSPDEESPVQIGNYYIGRSDFPALHGYSASENLLTVGVDSILAYDPVADAFFPLIDPRNPNLGIFSFVGEYGGELYYISDENNLANDGYQISKLENGVVSPVAISSQEIAIADNNYLVGSIRRLNDSTLISRFQPDGIDSERIYVSIKFAADGMTVKPLAPADAQGSGRPTYFVDGGFSFNFTDAEGNDQLAIFDNGAIRRLVLPQDNSQKPQAVGESGVFVETIDEETLETSFLFISFADPENPETLSFDAAVPSYVNTNYYVVGGNLVFTAISLTVGEEWHVAIPGTGGIVPLVDINPGTGLGAPNRAAVRVGDFFFFNGNDGTSGNEPWISDGTPENTRMIADVFPGEFSSNPRNYYLAENTIFFAANGPQGYEVYRMGTGALTPELIINLNAADGDSHPYGFTLAGEDLYFMGRETAGETYELYRIAFELVPTDAEPTRIAAKIYPNPVREQPLTVQAPAGEEFVRLQLFNQQGQLLREDAANGNASRFNLTDLPAGTYWLRSWYTSGRFSINAVQRVK